MRFSCDWLHDFLEAPLPAPAELSARLTASGFETGVWDEVPAGSEPDLPRQEIERRRRDGLPVAGDAHAGTASSGIASGSDVAIEVDITANRPDVMNHFGLAREIAAALDRSLRVPEFDLAEGSESATSRASVAIEAHDLCPRYVGRVVTGLRVAPSPPWLRRRLEAIGLTPKNNLVDASNYVLFELGQPLHAFDLKRLSGSGVVARRARAGETIVTVVDREEKKLAEGMLVIAEAGSTSRPGRPAAIAGVMGGFDTAISDTTTDVLVESAWFDPRSVARTSRALGLRTDASQRFERGADPGMTLFAADRLAALLAELGGGRVLSGAIDARAPGLSVHSVEATGSPARRRFTPAHGEEPIVLRIERATALLGVPISTDEAAAALSRLFIEADTSARSSLSCRVPTWRADLTHEVDLIEECARMGGYDAIPATLPAMPPPVPREGAGEAEDRARRTLSAFGHREIITYAMIARGDDERFGALPSSAFVAPLIIENPLSDRWEVMRRSLLPGVAGTLAYNLAHGREDLRLFEVASVHGAGPPPREARAVAIGAAGLAHEPTASRPQRPYDLHDLSGALESLVSSLAGRRVALSGSAEAVDGGASSDSADTPPRVGSIGHGRERLAFVPTRDAWSGSYTLADMRTAIGPGHEIGEELPAWLTAALQPGPFHPMQSFVIFWKGTPIGRGGRLSAEVEKSIESDRPLFLAEMLLEPFLRGAPPVRFRPLSRLNPVARDLSFFVPSQTPFARIEQAMADAVREAGAGPSGAPGYALIDRFEGKSVPDGRVSYAFRFRFSPRERALTAEEINGAIDRIASHLASVLEADIRSR